MHRWVPAAVSVWAEASSGFQLHRLRRPDHDVREQLHDGRQLAWPRAARRWPAVSATPGQGGSIYQVGSLPVYSPVGEWPRVGNQALGGAEELGAGSSATQPGRGNRDPRIPTSTSRPGRSASPSARSPSAKPAGAAAGQRETGQRLRRQHLLQHVYRKASPTARSPPTGAKRAAPGSAAAQKASARAAGSMTSACSRST